MNRSEALFTVIDVVFHPFQNYIKIKGLTHEKDVIYSDEHPRNKMDLIYRKTEEKMPVLVNMHGGGFVKGDKRHRRSFGELFAEKGFFVVNINYRLSPENVYPSPLEDVFKALNKIEEISEKYNLDLNKVFLTGDSSGGYLASHTTAALFDDGLREGLELPECSIKPAGLVSFCAPYDFEAAFTRPIPFGITTSIAESITGLKLQKHAGGLENYKYIKYAPTLNFINEKWCPVFVAYSKKDVFCGGQGELFFEKLKEKNIRTEFACSEKLADNHCYHMNFWTKASKETFRKVFKFLDDVRSGNDFGNSVQ